MAEPHHNTNMFRPPFNPSAVLAPPAHPTLSENAPIDQFIQSGADGSSYYPGYATPSEHDYFSLFAEFAMDLTPPPSLKRYLLASFRFSKITVVHLLCHNAH